MDTNKRLFCEKAIKEGKSLLAARKEYKELNGKGDISASYWKSVKEIIEDPGETEQNSEKKGKSGKKIQLDPEDVTTQEEEDPEEEENETYRCGQCGKTGPMPPPRFCPGCGVEFERGAD